MHRILIACACALVFATPAFSQIIYQPIRYQYGGQRPYYYGGNDPLVFQRAERLSGQPGFGIVEGYSFVSGNIDTHREVAQGPQRVYSDSIPLQNAAIYGYTASDAANAANLNVPRYFRKADLLLDATIESDGVIIVPPRAGTVSRIDIRKFDRAASMMRRNAALKAQPLMIIPKELWNQPLPLPSDKLVAMGG